MNAPVQIQRSSAPASAAMTAARSSAEVDAMVKAHAGLVRPLAWKVYARIGHRIEIDDLVQIGRVALVEAAYAFIDYGDERFAAYASMRIRGAMIDELRQTATISRTAIRYRRQFDQVRDRLAADLGRQPCEAEMAAAVDMSVAGFRAAEASTHGIEFAPMEESYSDHNVLFADSETPDAQDALEAARAQRAVAAAVERLPYRERLVLQLFFVEEMSLAEIGKVLDVCGARVCQIKKAAMARLRPQLGGWSVH